MSISPWPCDDIEKWDIHTIVGEDMCVGLEEKTEKLSLVSSYLYSEYTPWQVTLYMFI